MSPKFHHQKQYPMKHSISGRQAVRWFLSVLACTFGAAAIQAQTLPPIYDGAATEAATASAVAEYPLGSFLENIAIGRQGQLFVNSYLEGKVYRIDAQGQRSTWATVDGTIAGIALNPDGSALLSGWVKGKEPAVFSVTAQGRSTVLLTLPGGQFPNGVLRLAAQRFLVADSYKGVIWEVDARARKATVWLEHELLARASTDNPTPAVNGIKLFGGALYASNTAKQLLVRVPIVKGRPGTPEVVKKDIGLDDFDFDRRGNLYGATHVYNSLVRLAPDGQVTVLAGLAQGMAGSTAVAARPTARGVELFVTTNGGMSLPPEGGVQTGKVVRVLLPAQP